MEVCRLCRRDLGKTRHHKTANKLKDLIKKAFATDVENDCPCQPTDVCDRCRVDLNKFKRHYQHKKKPFRFSINFDNSPHLLHCGSVQQQPPVTPSLSEAATAAARHSGFVNWQDGQTLIFAKMTKDAVSPLQIQIEMESGKWKVLVRGIDVTKNTHLNCMPDIIDATNVNVLLEHLSTLTVCQGCTGFTILCRDRFPQSLAIFKNKDGVKVSSEEQDFVGGTSRSSVRHVSCLLLSKQGICNTCREYKKVLTALQHRVMKQQDIQQPHASTPFTHLSQPQLLLKVRELHEQNKKLKKELQHVEKLLNVETKEDGIEIPDEQDTEFSNLMEKHDQHIQNVCDKDSASFMLWNQHMTNVRKGNAKQNRWHPLILRWCIALHYKSSAAYEFIRDSGMISLPHRTTLRKYTMFTNPTPGYNEDIIQEIMRQTGIEDVTEDFRRNVTLIFDEVKIHTGLVYKRSTGKILGYTDLGDINNHLMSFQRRIEAMSDGSSDVPPAPDMATHILSVMVRGIFTPLHSAVAFFPTQTASGDQLYNIMWEGVEALEAVGFNCRAFVADGASTNRKFFKIHSKSRNSESSTVIFCTRNRYSPARVVYFICDVPHLLKTVRNNWENSGSHNRTRKLMIDGQEVTWRQLVNLKEAGDVSVNSPGYNKMYKITADHLELNPSTRMKVKLAAQVLSHTVATGFEDLMKRTGRRDLQSTVKFVRNFNDFFDCLNVQRKFQDEKGNKNLATYTSPEDKRFQWLQHDFLGWLNDWEKQCLEADLSPKEQRKMCLSTQTLEGLRITVHSFVSLAKELLALPGTQFLLSDKFNQDPLEEYFSKIQSAGGTRTNPTTEQYGDASMNILVGGNCIRGSLKGNCKRQSAEDQCILPLPKKR